MTEPQGLLHGVKVVACSTAQTSTLPYTPMADLGAEGIKIEVPEVDDNSRGSSILPDFPQHLLRNEQSRRDRVTLNLKTPGRARNPL
jgi:crotonobetainyl-CoA:carnitine CoA-transferase CaiB-like acyl-CoA transferase